MTYTYNAVWVLQSVFNAEKDGEGADLRDMISVGDYMQHAVMSYQEFTSGLELLLKLKLVSQDGLRLRTSDDFKRWYEEKMKGVKRPFPQREGKAMEQYVRDLVQTTTGDPDVRIQISEDDLNRAIALYRETF